MRTHAVLQTGSQTVNGLQTVCWRCASAAVVVNVLIAVDTRIGGVGRPIPVFWNLRCCREKECVQSI